MINKLTIMNIENKYSKINEQNMDNMEKLVQDAIEKVTIRPDDSDEVTKKKEKNQEDIIKIAGTPKVVFDHIIRDAFVTDNEKYTFIFYSEITDRYYAIYNNNNKPIKLVKSVNFEKDLSPVLKKVFNDILDVICNDLRDFCSKNNINLASGDIKPEYLKMIKKTPLAIQLGRKGHKLNMVQQLINVLTVTDDEIKQCSSQIFAIDCKEIEVNQDQIITENKELKNELIVDTTNEYN
jgi:hypothetical protein